MAKRFQTFVIGAAVILGLLLTVGDQRAVAADSVLTDAQRELLANSRFVYISSKRKDGTFGKPSEIWFFFHDDAVWVGTSTDTWRVLRIKAGRPEAKIAIGKIDGPEIKATGAIVKDTKVEELLYAAYAKKYPEGWPKHAQGFRDGFKSGARVLIKYTPSK